MRKTDLPYNTAGDPGLAGDSEIIGKVMTKTDLPYNTAGYLGPAL
jgi:hypothetical protein